MSIKILKPIRRFWRGLTRRMRATAILFLCVILVTAGFGIYLLARPEAGESEATRMLFPGVERDAIASVLCHTKSGKEYTVKGEKYTETDSSGTPATYKWFFVVTPDGSEEGLVHRNLSLNATQLSYFVVGTGKNFVYSAVIAPTDEAYESKSAELGFTENAPYYVLTTESGESYRVEYGIKDVTGDGYYVRLAGDGTIYSTKSAFVGDLLLAEGPESLIEPTLFVPSLNNYAHVYPQRYAVYDYERYTDAGLTVEDTHYAVGFRRKDAEGEAYDASLPLQGYENESEAAALLRAAIRQFFVGREIGKCNEEFSFTYPDNKDTMGVLAGESVRFTVEEITYVTKEVLSFDLKYLPSLDRELSHKFSVYAYTAPAEITSYVPNADAFMTILENTFKLTGTVVRLGLDDATITKYGLYRHQIHFLYPYAQNIGGVTEKDDRLTQEELEAKAEKEFFANGDNFLPGHLYVSDRQADGSRYVASIFYDLVVKVDGEKLSFLDNEPEQMVDDFMVTTSILDISRFQMFWNYGANKWLSEDFTFEVTTGTVTNTSGQENVEVTGLTAKSLDGTQTLTLDPLLYSEFFARLTYTKYKGEHGLSEDALAAYLTSENCVLEMRMQLADGTLNYWEFYPISANRAVVRVRNGKHAEEGTSLVVYGTALSDIARAYVCLMEGKPFDYEDRYE